MFCWEIVSPEILVDVPHQQNTPNSMTMPLPDSSDLPQQKMCLPHFKKLLRTA